MPDELDVGLCVLDALDVALLELLGEPVRLLEPGALLVDVLVPLPEGAPDVLCVGARVGEALGVLVPDALAVALRVAVVVDVRLGT